MSLKTLFSSFVCLVLLLSCSGHNNAVSVAQTTEKMADPMGINIVMMDAKLTAMIDEAKTIESQMGQLLHRLNQLKQSIAQHYTEPSQDVDQVMESMMPKDTAKAKPETLLPAFEMESKPLPQSTPKVEKKIVPESKAPTNITPTSTEQTVDVDVAPSVPLQKSGVMDVRVGVHSDKTRLVFDITGSTEHQLFHDKDVGIFTITLPETPWNTLSSRTYAFNQLAGYEAKATGNGTIVAMAIKNTSDVKILALDKTADKPARLVVDLIK